jgi:hypothetical protein
MSVSSAQEWMTHREAAAYLRTTENALHVARSKRRGHVPPAYKFGKRLLYKRSEVEACVRPLDT